MKTKDFLKKHEACIKGAKWALSIGGDMADVWDALVEQKKHDWLIWTVTSPGVFPVSVLRKLSCRFVRETPLPDGRKVWDLLTDERSRKAVEVAELYADGKATDDDLETVYDAAAAAYYAAYGAAAYAAAYGASDDAIYAVAAAARAAYAAAYGASDDAIYAVAAAAYDAAAYNARAAADATACAAADATACADAYATAAAARDAAYAAYATADDAAKAAQVQMIAEMGNPFKKERAKQ